MLPDRESVSCAVCGKEETTKLQEAKSLYGPEHYSIVRCNHCGLVFVNPRQVWSKKRGDLEHMKVEQAFHDISHRDEGVYRFVLDCVGRYREFGRILDIGCSTGRLLFLAQQAGYATYGIELNRSCADYCRNLGSIEIFQGECFEAGFQENYFDIITMIHSIEHLYNLRDDFVKISRIIKRGGLICIVTPNFNNYLIRFFKKLNLISERADSLDPTGHPYMFTCRSLVNLLRANGFKIIRASGGITGNFLLKRHKFFRLILKPLCSLIGLLDIGSTLVVIAEKE